jgi:hypothetical protein
MFSIDQNGPAWARTSLHNNCRGLPIPMFLRLNRSSIASSHAFASDDATSQRALKCEAPAAIHQSIGISDALME